MQCSRETKMLNTICIILVLSAGFARLLGRNHILSGYNGIIFTLFTTAIMIWIYQLQRRLLQPAVRRYLIVTACMMILWMAVRTIKYEFLPTEHFTNRYEWYLYYIPLILISLLMFFSVLHIGRAYDQPISRRWKLLYIPAILLMFGVLTNDFHQLAFRFPKGVSNWDDTHYKYDPLYYAVVVWMVILFLDMMVIVFVKCAVPANRKKIWVPMVPFFVGIVYTVFIVLNVSNVVTNMFKLPEIGCFVFVAFLESLIMVGLFPSNDSNELKLALAESLEYVQLYGIKAQGFYEGEERMSGENLLLAYELFEMVLENVIPGADAVFVNLHIQNDILSLQMEVNAPKEILSEKVVQKRCEAGNGTVRIETEGETEYISIVLPAKSEG